jgi:glycosyltransferase involved in cell wall biosynthesis
MRRPPVLVHLTTVDMSLSLLLLRQLVAFREAGFRVVGVSAPGPYVADLHAAGIEHFPLTSSTRSANLLADLRTSREFHRICRRLRPDIVHTHNPKPGIYGRVLARTAGVPVVVNTVHGLYAQPTDRWTKRAVVYGLERFAATCSDMELVQNAEDIPVLERIGIPAERIRLLGNGIDLTRFDPRLHQERGAALRRQLGIGSQEIVIGAVGRLVREKGYPELFEAASEIAQRFDDVRFVVAGHLDEDKTDALTKTELETAAGRAPITFLGPRRDVEAVYAMTDVYVLASHREGFPRSAMEAAAMGLPIVATDIRGCRQVVDDSRSGLLVGVRRADQLSRGLARLISDPAERVRFGEAARSKAVREFDDRFQVDLSLQVYEQLTKTRGSARAGGPRQRRHDSMPEAEPRSR